MTTDRDDTVRATDVLGPGGPRLNNRRCDTCIFNPGNPMMLRPGRVRQMVNDSLAGGGFITCHDTLPWGPVPGAKPAICRGFFDAYGHLSNTVRIFGRLGGFDEVDPPAVATPTTLTDQENRS